MYTILKIVIFCKYRRYLVTTISELQYHRGLIGKINIIELHSNDVAI
jgi:hypothetical protein